ncbi:PGF-pre-PGF domain-containing protein [archaeon]|nr:PGF-pre-PGF domain-containing protein [archaeon]
MNPTRIAGAVFLVSLMASVALAAAPTMSSGFGSAEQWRTSTGTIGILNFTIIGGSAVDSNITNLTISTSGSNITGNLTVNDNSVASNISNIDAAARCYRYNETLISCNTVVSSGVSGGGFFWVSFNFTNRTYGIPGQNNPAYVNITAFNDTNTSVATTANVSSYATVWLDNQLPTVANFTLLSSTNSLILRGARNNTPAGTVLNVSFNISDSNTGNLSSFNITYIFRSNNTTIYCLVNSSINKRMTDNLTAGTGGGNGCVFNSTGSTPGGAVDLIVNISDIAGNWINYNISNFTFIYGANSTTVNPVPIGGIQGPALRRFSQNRPTYSIPVPYFQGRAVADDLDNKLVIPFFTDVPMFQGPTVIENLIYNYTFNISTGDAMNPVTEVLNLSIFVPGMLPTVKQAITISTPIGTANITQYTPAFGGGFRGQGNGTGLSGIATLFTIFVGNYTGGYAEYNSTPSGTKIVNGTFDNVSFNGTITLNLLVKRGELYNVTIMLQPEPPVRMNDQQISGLNETFAPQLGTSVGVVFLVNVTATNSYYTPENMTLDFFVPLSVNYSVDGQTGNFTIASNMSLSEWNYTDGAWSMLVNESLVNTTNFDSNRTRNYSSCFAFTEGGGSRVKGAGGTFTLCMGGWRYLLSNISAGNPIDFALGTNHTLKFNAVLAFPDPPAVMQGTTPSGSAGTNSYETTIMMPMDGSINISSDKLPNISNAGSVTVIFNGVTLDSGQYSLGSLAITGSTASQGANTLSVTYTIASTASSSTGSGGGGGGGGGAAASTVSTVNIGSVSAGEPYHFTVPQTSTQAVVTDIVITPTETVSGANKVTVSAASLPSGVSAPSPLVYSYVDFTLSGITDAQLQLANVDFKVTNKWLSENSLAGEDVALYRYSSDSWNALPTTVVRSDAIYTYYSATVPGFSLFAVGKNAGAPALPSGDVSQPPAQPPAEQPGGNATQTTAAGTQVKAAAGIDATLLTAAVVVLILIGLVYFFTKRKR